MTDEQRDRLYDLLPAVYRQRDAEQGYPLRALLRVIAEQVDVVEADIAQLYEDWFIETADDWVVPYIGDLIGYRAAHAAGQPGDVATEQGQQLNRFLIPRREVANTIGHRRRKGTLALLELLARDTASWPYARAVEFYRLLGITQDINCLALQQGRTVDLRDLMKLALVNGPFDDVAHTVDVRRIGSRYKRGRYNIPNVGLFIWRLNPYPVTRTEAFRLDHKPNCFTFSILANDMPLYTRPVPETGPEQIATLFNVPEPISRRALDKHRDAYYGESFAIWTGKPPNLEPVPPERIMAVDLADWFYEVPEDRVAVDPERGRIAFPEHEGEQLERVWVSYHYGFSADMGGGEYERTLSQPADHILYRIVEQPQIPDREFKTIQSALAQWRRDRPCHAVIELTDSRVYTPNRPLHIELERNQTLQIRAANRTRPVIRLLNLGPSALDTLRVSGSPGSRFTLDGVMIMGRSVRIMGGIPAVDIRHCTLVPGWTLDQNCEPEFPNEPSLVLADTSAHVTIEQTITGSIFVTQSKPEMEPVRLAISDSILDATSPSENALSVSAPAVDKANAVVIIKDSTVFGQVHTHAIELGENTIFNGLVTVARRQQGCLRFCYVTTPGSRTPRRYFCQPDRVEQAAADEMARRRERLRVRPRFNSVRYGTPAYCQLADDCADEILRGADDESEMGVFHDLFQPQRIANLRARLDEYVPAGYEAGIIFAS